MSLLLLGTGALVLWAVWRFMPREQGSLVVAMALTYQWSQVMAGFVYTSVTGRQLEEGAHADLHPMGFVGLGCVASLGVGFLVGWRVLRDRRPAPTSAGELRERWLWVSYLGATLGIGFVQQVAWSVPGLTQALLTLGAVRLGVVFLLFRRLFRPPARVPLVAVLLAGELLIGLTGIFAAFRESLVMAALAILEVFDRRRIRHWLAIGTTFAIAVAVVSFWTGVKERYRKQYRDAAFADSQLRRVEGMANLAGDWAAHNPDQWMTDVDKTVSRIWAIYFPGLALRRVPDVVPHQDGAILERAVVHLFTPRLFFPDKEVLRSDSEMVRRYSGVWVAGAERDTSIAFGYAGESYVDFGIPLMFLPVLFYGFVCGLMYRWLLTLIRHRELALAAMTVHIWSSMFLFERSWIKTLGGSGTLLMVVAVGGWALDRMLERRSLGRGATSPAPTPAPPAA